MSRVIIVRAAYAHHPPSPRKMRGYGGCHPATSTAGDKDKSPEAQPDEGGCQPERLTRTATNIGLTPNSRTIMTITAVDLIARFGLITLLSSLIGLEREWHEKPAGIRTNVMVGLGSTLITLASIQVRDLFTGAVNSDPARLAAQIVAGIGFIGAGAILRSDKGTVLGLTTAATLWVVAGLGIAVGMGLYLEAILATTFVFFTFLLLGKIVKMVRQYRERTGTRHVGHHEDHLDMAGRGAGERE